MFHLLFLPPPARYTIPVATNAYCSFPMDADSGAFIVFDRLACTGSRSYIVLVQTFMNALKLSSSNFDVEWVKYAQSSKVTSSQVKQGAILAVVERHALEPGICCVRFSCRW